MNHNPLKAFILVFFVFLAFLTASVKSFAQDASGGDDNSSDEQVSQEQTKETLNQISDLESKMQDNAKRLDALEKSVNQEAPAQAAPSEQAPAQEAPVQAAAPVLQVVSSETSPQIQSIPEMKTEPVDVLPQAPIYFAPLTGFPKEHTFELSEENFYSTLRESGNNAFGNGGFNGILYDHKAVGGFYGFYTAYTYRPLDAENLPINVYHVDLHGDYGVEDYNYGDDQKLRNINNYIVEPQAWLGKDFNFASDDRVTPYVGVGYRWYYEELKNKIYQIDEPDNIVLDSNSLQNQYLYIPVGAQLSIRPTDGWRIDMDGEYDYLVWGRATEYPFVITNGAESVNSSSINNTLNKGYGIRGSVKIIKEGYTFNYFVEPYVEYWNIRPSKVSYFSVDGSTDTSDAIQQDKNTTTEIGARVGVDF